jgi:sialic acid synthase SpsE
MVRQARSCGADTIKFQCFNTDKLVNPGEVESFCRKSQLSYEDICAIIDECEHEDVNPLFSAFDKESLEMLLICRQEAVKIPSGQVFNHDLLRLAAMHFHKVYLSTGMCSMKAVRDAVGTLRNCGCEKEEIVVMQCTTCYPAPFEDANLRVIPRYMQEFGTPVGYSDHTPGWSSVVGAVALGASVIEKHFILNPQDETPDACVSLNPVEFRMMTLHIREIEKAVGTHVKRPRKCEQKMFKRRDYGGKNE